MLLRVWLLILLVMLAGCSSKKVSLYMLSTSAPIKHKVHTSSSRITYVGMDKVVLPEYLQNDNITTRVDKNQLHQNEFHQWAEPLSHNIARVVALNVHNKLRNTVVEVQPWPYFVPMKYRLHINIIRFDSDEYCVSRLIATWAIYQKGKSKLLFKRTKSYRQHYKTNSIKDIVAAMNININHFSDDVARSLRQRR